MQVQVNTTVPALAPDEVEKLVTMPLEMALGGVAGVTEMRSLSRFGLSQITLQFTDKSRCLSRASARDRAFAKRGRFAPAWPDTEANSNHHRTGRGFLLHDRLIAERAERLQIRAKRS